MKISFLLALAVIVVGCNIKKNETTAVKTAEKAGQSSLHPDTIKYNWNIKGEKFERLHQQFLESDNEYAELLESAELFLMRSKYELVYIELQKLKKPTYKATLNRQILKLTFSRPRGAEGLDQQDVYRMDIAYRSIPPKDDARELQQMQAIDLNYDLVIPLAGNMVP